MLKYIILTTLIGCAAAEVSMQDQIYVVSGVLGGVCLLLTIILVYNLVTIVKLQNKVAVLQATGTAASRALADTMKRETLPQAQKHQPQPQRYGGPSRGEELNRLPRMDDPYRAPSRDGYRMDRLNHENYYEDHRYVLGGPAPPSRSSRPGPSARERDYY